MGLALDEPGEGEATTQVNGVDVLIRDDVLPYAWSTQVDYASTPYAEGFTIGSGGSSCC